MELSLHGWVSMAELPASHSHGRYLYTTGWKTVAPVGNGPPLTVIKDPIFFLLWASFDILLLPVTELEGKPIPRQEALEDTLRHMCGSEMQEAPHFQSHLFSELSQLMTTYQNNITGLAQCFSLAFCPATLFSPRYYLLKIHKLGFLMDQHMSCG